MNLTTVLFERNSLQSRVIRELVGDRVINLVEDIVEVDAENGIFSSILGLGGKIIGFVASALLGSFVWGLTEIIDLAVEAYFELKHFDWNQTDAELQRQLEANDVLLASALGQLTGTGLVWLTGIAVASGLTIKYPVVAGRVALALAEEGGTEIRSALTNLITVSRQNAVRGILLGGLLNARKLELLGFKPVTEERKPWSIAEGIDNFVEQFLGAEIKAFLNGFVDAVEDAVIEMGYVIAYTLDDYFMSQRLANESLLGQERTIELTPDVQVEDERVIIESPQELAIANTQAAMVEHQLIYNRDVGQIAGMPELDYRTPNPQGRKLTLIFRGKQTPPWRLPDGTTAMTAEANIPDVQYGLTWEKIKKVAQPYTWGKYRVTAHLSNGRQMAVHAVSYGEGEKQLREYVKLSTAVITRFNYGLSEPVSDDPRFKREATLVYPAYCKLTIGDLRPDGSLRSNRKNTVRVDLWTTEEPDNSDQLN